MSAVILGITVMTPINAVIIGHVVTEFIHHHVPDYFEDAE